MEKTATEVLYARVPSLTRPGESYTVELHADGRFPARCTCPANARRPSVDCKHIKIARLVDGAERACCAAGHVDGDGQAAVLCAPCAIALVARLVGKVRREYVRKKPRAKKKPKEAR